MSRGFFRLLAVIAMLQNVGGMPVGANGWEGFCYQWQQAHCFTAGLSSYSGVTGA